jgi:hypothetical protein
MAGTSEGASKRERCPECRSFAHPGKECGFRRGPERRPLDDLLEQGRVLEADGCHSFHGSRKKYPHVGSPPNRVQISRYLAEVTDPKVEVRHTCDNNWCINPEHLLTGSSQQNSDDMVERARSNRGTKHWNARLTEQQVQQIRADPRSSPKVAPEFGVSARQIRKIRQGSRWTTDKQRIHRVFQEEAS